MADGKDAKRVGGSYSEAKQDYCRTIVDTTKFKGGRARNGSSTDTQAYHMSVQHPPLIRVSASPFTREPGSREELRKRRRRDPQGNGNRLVIRKGWRSINPTVRNKQRSVPTFPSIAHLSLRRFESLSIRERLDRMSGMVSTCPSSKCYASSADP